MGLVKYWVLGSRATGVVVHGGVLCGVVFCGVVVPGSMLHG